MFIEVTLPTGEKMIFNTRQITSVYFNDFTGNGCAILREGDLSTIYTKESYDAIRTLLNTKWVAE